jgi:hypothetical protein
MLFLEPAGIIALESFEGEPFGAEEVPPGALVMELSPATANAGALREPALSEHATSKARVAPVLARDTRFQRRPTLIRAGLIRAGLMVASPRSCISSLPGVELA